MDDTSPRQGLTQASTGLSARTHAPGQIGAVTVVSGFKLSCALFGADAQSGSPAAYERVQIGDLIKVPTSTTTSFGSGAVFVAPPRHRCSGSRGPRSSAHARKPQLDPDPRRIKLLKVQLGLKNSDLHCPSGRVGA